MMIDSGNAIMRRRSEVAMMIVDADIPRAAAFPPPMSLALKSDAITELDSPFLSSLHYKIRSLNILDGFEQCAVLVTSHKTTVPSLTLTH
jgi:hypothetical protein